MLFDDFDRLRVGRAEPVFVDNGCKPFQPAPPAFAGDGVEDTLAERARIRRAIEPFGFLIENQAMNGSGHDYAMLVIETRFERGAENLQPCRSAKAFRINLQIKFG